MRLALRRRAAWGTDTVPRSIRPRRPRTWRAFEISELNDSQVSLEVCRAAKVSAMTKQDTVASDMALMRRCVFWRNPRVQRANTRLRLSSDDEANSFANRSIWSGLNEMLHDTPRWSQSLQLRKSCDPRALTSARSIQRSSPAPCVLTPSGKAGSVE